MLDRFKRGPIPADQGTPVYDRIEDYPGDGHDPSLDGDQSELISLYPVDPALVKAHEAEVAQ